MKVRTIIVVIIVLLVPAAVRAEDAWLRAELLRGIDLIFNADISGGAEVFSAIEKQEPKNPAPYVYRAMALMSYPPREGMSGIDRTLIEGLLERGIRYAREGSWDGDEGRVKLLLATAYSLLAQLALDERQYLAAADAAIRAEKCLADAERASPDDPDVRYGVGLLAYGTAEMPAPMRSVLSLMDIRGDRERGIQDLKTAAEHGVYTKTSARVALLMITANIEDRYEDAVVYGRELVEEYPNNPELYFPYANALSETGDREAAWDVVRTLGQKIDGGVPYFDGAIVGRYHHLMGKLLMDQRRYTEAAAELSRALVVTDKNYAWVRPLALARLGMIEDASGRREKAVEYYREAIDTKIEGAGIELSKRYLEKPYAPGGGK
jgi:tetratricopeptide (TPR) repeat protein